VYYLRLRSAFFISKNLNIFKKINLLYRFLSTKSDTVRIDNFAEFDKQLKAWLEQGGTTDNTGYIASCVDIWGLSFAKVTFRIYDSSADNKELDTHLVNNIFKKPNWFQTWWEIKYRIASDFSYWGNSYLLKLKDGLKTVTGLVQLHPDRVTTYPHDKEAIEYYNYNLGSNIQRIEPADIIHLRYPAANNYIKGAPVIGKIVDLREIERMQIAYRKQFYKRGGFLGATFTTEQKMTDTSFKRAKEELQENYSGEANVFKIALFEQGLKPIPTAYSLKDMQMTEERNLNRDEILSAWKVNKLLLGQSELVQRGNAETVFYIFASMVIDPLMNYIDECLTAQWTVVDYDRDFYIKHDMVANEDEELNLKRIDNGIKNGWLSVNEVRNEGGYEQWETEYDRPKPVKQTSESINQI